MDKHMLNISKDFSERIAGMSFLCACMIVFFHASPAPDKGSFNWWFFHLFGREGICCIAVPFFFACSGYFLAGHFGEQGWWLREVKKRIKSLVIPYFIWMVIYLIFAILVVYAKNRFFNLQIRYEFLGGGLWEQITTFVGLHPFRDIGVLWYVRSLFLMVLVSPILFFLLKRPILVLVSMFSLHLALSSLFCNSLDLDMYFLFDRFVSVRGLFYFLAGAALHICGYGEVAVDIKQKKFVISLCIGAMLLVGKSLLLIDGNESLSAACEALAVPCLIVGIWGLVPALLVWKRFAKHSFPIFLMHNIFLSLVSMAFMAMGLKECVSLQIPIAFFRSMVAIGGAILVASVLHKFAPRFASVVFGGR